MTKDQMRDMGYEIVVSVRDRIWCSMRTSRTQLERSLWQPKLKGLITKKHFRQLYEDAKREWLRWQLDYAMSCKANDAVKLIVDAVFVAPTDDDGNAIVCLEAAIRSVKATPAERIATEVLQGVGTAAERGSQ